MDLEQMYFDETGKHSRYINDDPNDIFQYTSDDYVKWLEDGLTKLLKDEE